MAIKKVDNLKDFSQEKKSHFLTSNTNNAAQGNAGVIFGDKDFGIMSKTEYRWHSFSIYHMFTGNNSSPSHSVALAWPGITW